jgi:hypothetical protein
VRNEVIRILMTVQIRSEAADGEGEAPGGAAGAPGGAGGAPGAGGGPPSGRGAPSGRGGPGGPVEPVNLVNVRYQHADYEEALAEEGAHAEAGAPKARPFVRQGQKVGRNEPCPCGSGKKYKQCHGRLA